MTQIRNTALKDNTVVDFKLGRLKPKRVPPVWALSVMQDITDYLSQCGRLDERDTAEDTTRMMETLLSSVR